METGQGISAQEDLITRLAHFAGELGRRRVWRTALAYGASVFVLLQVGEIVFPAFGAPDWALRALVVASFLFFPLVLCLAWVFDITPRGIRKALGVQHRDGVALGPGLALPRLALLAVTFATVGGMGWWTVQEAVGRGNVTAQAAEPGPALAAGTAEQPLTVRSLAVLPLDDFSEEEGGESFTAGLHEEIISQLSRAGTARVVSRTSVVQYDRSGKTMPTIARDLGADAVLEGSVFRSGDRVRITVQLIHGPTDTHLWAESYEGSSMDAIAFQADVAERIAAEIQEKIAGGKDAAPQAPRVAEGVAVPDEFHQARRDESIGTPEALASAIQHYQNVLREDSSFAPAQRGLAKARIRMEASPEASERVDVKERIEGARRMAVAAHFGDAEGILLEVARHPEASEEAWQALEQIKTIRGDFEGILELRLQRLEAGRSDSLTSVAVHSLRTQLQEGGEAGFWAWKIRELEKQAAAGVEVSPVEMARARVGIGDVESALPYLEQAVAERDRNLVTLWVDPAWDALRADPRFRAVLNRARKSDPGGGFPRPDLPWPIP